ncbi:hypothetical protein PF007_g12372 [Phytophthora fragariae]|uniref:RxLR effector protein n=1 Tax=Phytophthora fragariae TaxID=53985 RepID=A0A6A3U8A6_9STRA|nr:hypothetical protein PF007_g12372 [Phytophthora fragariae]KAE9147748.1 hypothetical protein PF006_g7608 [Phytophthora fragariae]KAE9307467.1 hypothetical protein PF001_g11599 [Phytophthora fragariae]
MPAAWYMLALSTGATAAGSSDGRQEIDSAGIKRGSQSDSDGRRATATASSDSASVSAVWILLVLSNGASAKCRERRQLQ